jgi:hypothetical protein
MPKEDKKRRDDFEDAKMLRPKPWPAPKKEEKKEK